MFPSRGIFVQLGSDSERRVKTPGRRRERSGKSVRNSFPRTVVYVVEFGVPEVFADARTGKSGGDYQFYDAHVEHWIESVVHTLDFGLGARQSRRHFELANLLLGAYSASIVGVRNERE